MIRETDLIELRLLMSPWDYRHLLELKEEESLSQSDLALIGDIVIQSWRAYC